MAERYLYPVWVEGDWAGIPNLKNKLQIYFQSRKKSNGGDCQVDCGDVGERKAVVWFRTEETRQRILEKGNHELKLDKSVVKLTVRKQEQPAEKSPEPIKQSSGTHKSSSSSTLKDAPEESSVSSKVQEETTDSDEHIPETASLVLENVQEKMNKDFLEMLVENIADCSAESDFSLEIIYDINAAVVSFKNSKDVQTFLAKCAKNKMFRQGNLAARPLEVTTSVKVENVPSVTKDFMELYFEREGDVKEVLMMDGEQSAIVTFLDHRVAENVSRKRHQISKVPVSVYLYYESLGTALYGKDRPVWKLPDPFTESIDPALWKFLHTGQKQVTVISSQMEKHFCEVDLGSPTVRISPLPALLKQKGLTAKHIDAWKENASAAFRNTMSKYSSFEYPVNSSVWRESEKEIRRAVAQAAILEPDMAKESVAVAGLSKDANRLKEMLVEIVERNSKRLEREKNSITGQVDVEPGMYYILQQERLQETTAAEYPELKLTYKPDARKLILSGLVSEVFSVKSKILEAVLNMKHKQVEIDPNIFSFLSEVDSKELSYSIFTSQGISAVYKMEDGSVEIIGNSDKALAEAAKQLQAVLGFQHVHVEDRDVLRKPEWLKLVNYLKSAFNSPEKTVSIRRTEIDGAQDQIVVSGFCDPINQVSKQLSDFLNKNTHAVETVHFKSKAMLKFIQDTKSTSWTEKINGEINVKFDETNKPSIVLSGPRLFVMEAKDLFGNLIKSVYFDVLEVSKPGAKTFFSDQEDLYVSMALRELKCVVKLDDEDSLEEDEPTQSVYEVQTSDGVTVTVCKADICQYPADAVVNASNEKLEHIGGLALALLKAAGHQLQDLCVQHIRRNGPLKTGDAVITDAGRLPCKHVIHAVGPRFDGTDSRRAVCLLKRAVKESLTLAETHNCSSIAIPAISSGIFGFPLDLCAETIARSVREHCQDFYGENTLRKIHLVNNDDKTVRAMTAAVQKEFADETPQLRSLPAKPAEEHRRFRGGERSVEVESRGGVETVQTKEGLAITLRKGNIQDASTDVTVNTIAEDLTLDSGAVSKAILQAAGPDLQNLVYKAASAGSAGEGAVLVTDGCNLRSNKVFHVIAPHWDKGKGTAEKVFVGIIKECLKKSEQLKQRSMSFPAIGTGNLGFPKPLVASVMMEQVLLFSSKSKPKHLQEVAFLLHPSDTQTVQAFTDEFSKRFKSQTAKVKNSGSSSESASAELGKGFFGKVTSPNLGVHEMNIGPILLQIITGDITKETTDVIVNSSNNTFSLKQGVSKAILEAAGQAVETECQQLSAQPNKGLIMTQAGNLKSKKVIHIATQTDPEKICQSVKAVLQMCEENNFTSVSLPALGTGQGGASPSVIADTMLDAVVDIVSQKSAVSLQTVRVVIFQPQMLTEFYKSMQKREGTVPPEKGSVWSKIKSLIWGGNEKEEKQMEEIIIEGEKIKPAIFHICGETKSSVEKAKKWVEDLIIKEQNEMTIADEYIYSFTPQEHERIINLQRKLQVSVKLECTATQAYVKVEGLSRDVLKAVTEVQDMIKKIRDEETLKREAELASNLVEWQYEDGDKFLRFDNLTNLRLEQALANKVPDISITIQEEEYKVFLPNGPAVSFHDVTLKIRRINKTEAKHLNDLPQHWDSMAGVKGALTVVLQAGTPEYKEVEDLFKATCAKNSVLKIERIQNVTLWKNYQIRKQELDDKNGHQNNEKRLFHGTSEPTIKTINAYGFNRSFAGKNAACYGNGTYFAVNANYSAQNTYSVPDALGQKYMYLVKVLTGDFTSGRQGMIVPPSKNNSTIDLYDSVTDNVGKPTMFVIFNDIGAYPEYLITFR